MTELQTLQALIDDTPDVGTVVIPPGRYQCEQAIEVLDRKHLTIDGTGATIFATSTGVRGRDHFRIKNSLGITVRGLGVEGPHPNPGHYVGALEGQHAFHVVASHAVLLDGVKAKNVYADGVYIGSDSTWVHVKDADLRGMGRHGVCVTDGKIVGVTGSLIAHVGFSSVDLEPNAPQLNVWGVLVKDNCFVGGRLIWLTGAGTSQVDNVTADGNVLSASKAMGVHCYSNHGVRRVGWTITNNWSDKIAGAASETCMTFRGTDGLVVRRNTQPMQKGRNMVLAELTDCTDYDIGDNDLGPHAAGQFRLVP